jgi:8-oxo-dGTP pyrophosphatase MutT (NUDIX family)
MAEHPWRRGAVLLPIVAKRPHGVVFVERAQHLRRHPGQIGLPGGAEDPSDGGDPARTALRELQEEVGVEPERVTIVGRLPDLQQNLNRFVIAPIVGVLDAGVAFSLDGVEIVGVFTVPLATIVAPDMLYEDLEFSAARGKPMYALDYQGRHIWGFTARILRSFADAWHAPDSALRRAIEAALAKMT